MTVLDGNQPPRDLSGQVRSRLRRTLVLCLAVCFCVGIAVSIVNRVRKKPVPLGASEGVTTEPETKVTVSPSIIPPSAPPPDPFPDLDESVFTQFNEGSWRPANESNDTLPGFVTRPARLPEVRRWQVVMVAPDSAVNWLTLSPDGTQVACASQSGVIRIYVLLGILMGLSWLRRVGTARSVSGWRMGNCSVF
jgi:hypothetical protein